MTNGYRRLPVAGWIPATLIPVTRAKIGAVNAGLPEAAAGRVTPCPGLSKMYALMMRATVIEVSLAGASRRHPADNGVGHGVAKSGSGFALQFDRVSAPAVKTISRFAWGRKKPRRQNREGTERSNASHHDCLFWAGPRHGGWGPHKAKVKAKGMTPAIGRAGRWRRVQVERDGCEGVACGGTEVGSRAP